MMTHRGDAVVEGVNVLFCGIEKLQIDRGFIKSILKEIKIKRYLNLEG